MRRNNNNYDQPRIVSPDEYAQALESVTDGIRQLTINDELLVSTANQSTIMRVFVSLDPLIQTSVQFYLNFPSSNNELTSDDELKDLEEQRLRLLQDKCSQGSCSPPGDESRERQEEKVEDEQVNYIQTSIVHERKSSSSPESYENEESSEQELEQHRKKDRKKDINNNNNVSPKQPVYRTKSSPENIRANMGEDKNMRNIRFDYHSPKRDSNDQPIVPTSQPPVSEPTNNNQRVLNQQSSPKKRQAAKAATSDDDSSTPKVKKNRQSVAKQQTAKKRHAHSDDTDTPKAKRFR